MKQNVRKQLGEAVEREIERQALVEELGRPNYEAIGVAAVQEFLAPIMPTLRQVAESLLAVPELREKLAPIKQALEEYVGEEA